MKKHLFAFIFSGKHFICSSLCTFNTFNTDTKEPPTIMLVYTESPAPVSVFK